MKGNIPRFLRLALVVILAVSFSLVPMAVNPQPAAAALNLSLSSLKVTGAQAAAGVPQWIAGTGFLAGETITFTENGSGTLALTTQYTNLGVSSATPTGTTTPASARGDFVVSGTYTDTAAIAGATITNATAVITGSAVTLSNGTNTLAVTTAGTATVALPAGAAAVATSGTSAVTGSPQTLTNGATITLTGVGTFTVVAARTETVTITATGASTLSKAQAFTVASSVANQVKITAPVLASAGGGTVISYADPSQTGGDYARIFGFNRVGDGITIESLTTLTHVADATKTMGDFLSGGALTLTFDNVAQTLLGNTTVDSNQMAGGVANTNYRKFNSTFVIPAVTGSTVTGSASPPGAGKTASISDGVNKVFFSVYVTPKAIFSPNLGGKGATITVAGTGWARSKAIYIYAKNAPMAATDLVSANQVVTDPAYPAVTDTSGNFSVKFAALGGTNATSRISVADGDGSSALNIGRLDESGSSFTLKPSMTLSPSTAKVGDTITLSGTDWGAGVPFKVFFGTAVTDYAGAGYATALTGTTTATGDITPITFAVPATYGLTVSTSSTTPGSYKVYVIDSGAKNQNATLTVASLTLTVSPTSAGRGTKISISSSGLTPNGTVGVTLAGNTWTPTTTNSITSGGTWASEFNVPNTTSLGSSTVVVTDSGGRRAEGSITVTGVTLSVTPSSAPRFGKVIVSGSSVILASPNTTIPVNQLTIGGMAWNAVANSALFVSGAGVATTGVIDMASDSFSATIRIPTTADLGANEVAVLDASGQKVGIGKVTVTAPAITISPTSAVRNTIVTVNGTGWVPEESVTVYVGGAGTAAANTTSVSSTVSADGSFATTFKVPSTFTTDSNNNVGAADGKSNASAIATLKVPAASLTVSPTTVSTGQTVVLKGTGFARNTEIRYGFPWNGVAASRTFPTAVYTDSTGSFTADLVIPGRDAGTYSLGVADDTAATAATAISSIVLTEAPKTVANALAPIASQLVRVWSFDGATQSWKLYDPAVPAALNTLPALVKGSGYFINVTAATSITTGGVTISLYPGWNNIGWLD